MVFDARGDLWVASDVYPPSLARGSHEFMGHNGLFLIPTDGEGAGLAQQFASSPVAAELTGPCFTPDGRTLFLSVQHPGSGPGAAPEPASRWPHHADDIPRPAVIAITGF